MNVKHNQLQNATTICGGNLKKTSKPGKAKRGEKDRTKEKRKGHGRGDGPGRSNTQHRRAAGQRGQWTDRRTDRATNNQKNNNSKKTKQMVNVNTQREKKFKVGNYYRVDYDVDYYEFIKVVGRTEKTLNIEVKGIEFIDRKWTVTTNVVKVHLITYEDGLERIKKANTRSTAYDVIDDVTSYDRQFAEVILEIAGDKFDREGVDEASYKWAKQVMGVEAETETAENEPESADTTADITAEQTVENKPKNEPNGAADTVGKAAR